RGRFINELVFSGRWAQLESSDCAIIGALCSAVSADKITKEGESFVIMTRPEMMEASGLGCSIIPIRISELHRIGIITAENRGKGDKRSIFRLHFVSQNSAQRNRSDPTERLARELFGLSSDPNKPGGRASQWPPSRAPVAE